MSADVSMVDFEGELAEVRDEVEDAITDVLESGYFVLGEQVAAFESAFANATGVNEAVGVNSGTDAIMLSLRALGIGEGDQVIVPAISATATAAAVVMAGAEPVYTDVEADTLLMDIEDLKNQLTERTAAIVPVHLYGQPVDMDPLVEIAEENSVPVVEDCAQAHGATYKGKHVGTLGDAGAFSFYPTKNLGAYGDGGSIVTDDPDLAERVSQLREYGWVERNKPTGWGVNSRLDELQAAILNVKLPRLFSWNARRRKHAAHYNNILADTGVHTPKERDDAGHVYHLYVIRTDERERLRNHLWERRIQTQVHYPLPLHQQGSYGRKQHLPVAETATAEILSLPVHPHLVERDIEMVGAAIEAFSG